MNIASYLILLTIGVGMWIRSGMLPTRKYFFIGLGILAIIWWLLWGQFAIMDGWWVYNTTNINGGFLGAIPLSDFLYFFAGLGWSLYLGHKLGLF